MKKLKVNFWLQKHRKLLLLVMLFVALYITIVGMTKMDFCTLTENAGLFGVVGTLLGAFIGGVFSLMGSVWVNNKQQKAAQNIKRKNIIYSPLYDELINIQNNILEQNPFPWYIEFEKGPQTILPHPQYDAWRRIKSDTRYLEVPDYLKKQIEKLENTIHDYIEYRYKANVEIQTILNNSLSENGLSKCEIINIGQVLSSDILENKKNDFYNEAMMSDDNIDNDRKNIFNEVMLTKCNENMIIIETRKRYYAWCEVQKQTIEMLSIMIKQVLLKYEA
jgi:hypothetical protein